MATSYLDKTGLEHLWGKIKSSDDTKVDKNQGSANADKYLGTDSSGVVTLRDGLRVTDDGNGNVTIVDGVNMIAVVETYDLPIATSSTLGGVKPVAKTADMSQEVGVDENGLLYTNASAQSDWNEDDETDPAYVLNRPAIRAGEGENSVMIGQIEQEEDAAVYHITFDFPTEITDTMTFTTEDDIIQPSSDAITRMHYVCNLQCTYTYNGNTRDKSFYYSVLHIDTTNNIIKFDRNISFSNIVTYSSFTGTLYYHYKAIKSSDSVSEGRGTFTSGEASHAEGGRTRAFGLFSHAEGFYTIASGIGSHTEGNSTSASGVGSHVEGYQSYAEGNYSHAEGDHIIASGANQHAQGKYNIEDTSNTYADIVGNGTTDSRSNAYTLDWSGNGWYAGKLTVGATPTENMDVATKQYVDAATAGVSPNLSGLADTNIASPATGQILTYDGTTSKWVNTTSPYMTASQVNELIAAALAEYGDGDTASYGFEDASEVSY